MLRRMVLVRTDISEDLSASIARVTRIGELGTMRRLLVTANVEEWCLLGCYAVLFL
jgi:hypothetical protein